MTEDAVLLCCKLFFNKQNFSSEELVVFSFPKCAKKNAEWVHRCRQADTINLKTARICSKHFQEDDIDPSCLRKRSLGIKCRMFVKKDAIPSENLQSR